MKVQYKTKNGRFVVEFEASTQTELWKQLAEFQEVFEDLTCTKKVGDKVHTSDKVRFVVRNVDDNDFYELHCVEPGPLRGARKSFGVHKKGGTLFPKTKTSDGEWLPDFGWTKFNRETGKEE